MAASGREVEGGIFVQGDCIEEEAKRCPQVAENMVVLFPRTIFKKKCKTLNAALCPVGTQIANRQGR